MKGGTRKRGKTWSYYFDTAQVGGKRKKIEKADSALKRKRKRLWRRLSQNMKTPDRSFSHPPSASVIIWISGTSSIAK